MKRVPLLSASDPSRGPVCDRKAIYQSEARARLVGQNRLRETPDVDRLWPYACARCRYWHLTSMEQPGAAITARQQREGMDDPTH